MVVRHSLSSAKRWVLCLTAFACLATSAYGAECVFVTSIEGNSVLALDAHSLRLAREISVGFGPVAIAAMRSRPEVLVANRLEGTLFVIDADELVVEQSIEAGWLPSDILISPDEEWVYVANGVGPPEEISNTVSQINLNSHEWFALGFFFGPDSLAMNPSGDVLYVAGSAHIDVASLSLIDGVVKHLGIEGNASHIVLTPDGRYLFAAGTGVPNGNLTVADTRTGHVASFQMHRARHVAMSFDGSTAYVLSDGGTQVTPIDVGTGTFDAARILSRRVRQTLVSSDGRFLYAVPLEDGVISRMDLASGIEVVSAQIDSPGEAVLADCLYDCVGDCDRDGRVAISELVSGVRLALGVRANVCTQVDSNGDAVISISELVSAVTNALQGCLRQQEGE